jgi:DNA-directed RNA polymerase subunit beta'
MGHIGLAVPVVHIWFFRAQPSKIGNIIGLSLKEIEKVIYYESYIVLNPGPTGLNKNDLISEDQFYEVINSLPAGNEKLDNEDPKKFVARIGGDAIKEILKKIDVEKVSKQLRDQLDRRNFSTEESRYPKKIKSSRSI